MAVLAIYQADVRAAARLSTALLDGEHEILVLPSWEELVRSVSRGIFDGCLVDAEYPTASEARRRITALHERLPNLAIIASVEATEGMGYFALGTLGIAGAVSSKERSPTEIRTTVDRALATARAERIVRYMECHYASPGPEAVGWAVERAGGEATVEDLAAALGHSMGSLRQSLRDAGLPTPQRILLWGRLLLAGARLGRDRRTVEDVALSLGYATASSLARAMKAQTGFTPSEVSACGGMDLVRDSLLSPPARGRRTAGAGLVGALILTLLAGCAPLTPGSHGVDRDAIDAVVDAPPVERAHFGILAVDAHSGQTLYSRNAERWFVPASNQKILVTAAAWALLGPDYRFRTQVGGTGAIEDGRLLGDLVVSGSGDPSFSDRYWPSGTSALDAIADSVFSRGIRRIAGSLVVDVSAWDSTSVGPTREVADLEYGYGATGGAFAIDEGELDVVVRGASSVGAPAHVDWSPVGSPDFVRSRITTAPADSATRVVARFLPERRQLVLEGRAALGTVDTLAFAQRDPVRQAAAALAAALERRGITVDGGWTVRWPGELPASVGCRACQGDRQLAELSSPPLRELVSAVLGPSQNWIAEQLVLTLGAELGAGGSWPEGVAAVEWFLSGDVGIDSLEVSMRDGSGLSAYNLVTPRALVRVLQYMAARTDAAAYHAAMAEPGEVDSTLEGRLEGLEGRVFAKTGSISNVNTLSGYLTRRNGRHVVFSILSNGAGVRSSDAIGAIDEIVRILAD